MIWVLVTKASESESINVQPNYLELIRFDSLIDAVNWGLKQYYSIIIDDQKQQNDYNIYKDDIEDRGLEFVQYDYHLTIYDGYIE